MLWPFSPQADAVESLEWLTDVLETRTGEQRISLRVAPRRGLQYKHLFDPGQFSEARALIPRVGAGQIKVPLWHYFVGPVSLSSGDQDIQFDPSFCEYRGGDQIIIFGDGEEYELATLEEVTQNGVILKEPITFSYPRAIIAPVADFWVAQSLAVSRGPSDYMTATAYFLGLAPATLPNPVGQQYPQLGGHDVLTDAPDTIGGGQDRYSYQAEWIDPGFGIRSGVQTRDYLDSTFYLAWTTISRESLWRLRHWLYARRGRQVGFWLPSFNNDLTLAASITSPSSTTLTVRRIGLRDTGWQKAHNGRGVRIILHNGGVYYNRILSTSASGSPEFERITLAAPVGLTATPAQIASIEFLDFCRLDADRVEIRHKTAQTAAINVPVRRVPPP